VIAPDINIWTGAVSSLWSDDGNWSKGLVPVATDRVLFNDTSTTASFIDDLLGSDITIAKLHIYSTYNNTITQEIPLTITGSYVQEGGVFTCATPGTTAFSAGSFSTPTTADSFNRYTLSGGTRVLYDVYGLQAMTQNLNSDYRLNNDIDASGTSAWNGGAGFVPVGDNSTNFTGTFDGDYYTITGLTINRATTNYVGLFGYTYGSTIQNIGLEGGSVTGQNTVGSLVGYSVNSSTVSGSYATGSVSGSSTVGGLVGYSANSSTVSGSYATGSVRGSSSVGGLVGYSASSSTVFDSYATGSVSGSSTVGGLVGGNGSYATISDSYATGNVSGSQYLGGLVGSNTDHTTISNSYASGTVSGSGSIIGGLVGYNQTYATISNSYATGSVSAASGFAGGLVGYHLTVSAISNSYATGSVSAASGSAGGLVGYLFNGANISNSYATGVATSTSDTAGGLIGYSHYGSLTNNWWYNDINSQGIGAFTGSSGEVTKAGAVTDFYGTGSGTGGAVYRQGYSDAWDFDLDWIEHAGTFPTLTLGVTPTDINIWTGAVSGLWSDAGNWSKGITPVATDRVLFNDTGTASSSINDLLGPDITIARLHIYPTYTGTITQEIPLTITGDYFQEGGVFTASDPLNDSLSVGGSFSIPTTADSFSRYALDGSIHVLYDVYGLQAMKCDLGASYRLNNDVDASATSGWNSGTGFVPVENFSGVFEGDAHTITGFTINLPNTVNVGLFGSTSGATIRNVGLIGGSVEGLYNVGGLVGYSGSSIISNTYVSGNISGHTSVGGLVGYNPGTTIDNSYALGSVTGLDSYVGGLVGYHAGTINDSYSSATVAGARTIGGLVGISGGAISNSYATGNVSGSSYTAGGLVGQNSSSIDNCYATGGVSGTANIGGLVGISAGAISNSYATGAADSTDTPGGLIGQYDSGVLTNNWWYNGANFYAVGNTADVGNKAGSVNDFYGTGGGSGGVVYRQGFADAWDFDFDWLEGVSYPTLGVNPNTNVWVDAGSGLWSDATNWSLGIVPGTLSAVIFNSSNINDSIINGPFGGVVGKLRIDSGYAGTITQGRSFTVTGNYEQSGGKFVCNDPLTYAFSAGSFSVPAPDGGTSYFSRFTGTGAPGDPFIIRDVYDLQAMQGFLTSSFVLNNNLNASSTADWNNGAGFMPVGRDWSHLFTGMFDGANHTITGLVINRPSTHDIGLFGFTSGATLQNVGLVGGSVTGNTSVGGLVGHSDASSISNAYSALTVTGTDSVGGLVGYSGNSTIDNSYALGTVNGNNNVGGFVGYNYAGSHIDNSYATGNITGTGGSVGGLVGNNYSAFIDNSYATGGVSGTDNVGGLAGQNYNNSSISNSYATGTVTGDSNFVGGLVGYNYNSASISNAYATGAVSGTTSVGGLVGYNNGASIDNSYATGVATSSDTPGGLIGSDGEGTLTNNWWYNDTNSEGIGSGNLAGVTKAVDASDFYSPGHAVYDPYNAGGSRWAFMDDGAGVIWTPVVNNGAKTASYPILAWQSGAVTMAGDGSVDDPYQVTNVGQLQMMVYNLGANYVLANNVNADIAGYNTGSGFLPVGNDSVQFSGTFDGLRHTVKGLTIDRSGENYVGLFGYVSGAVIRNTGLVGGSVTGAAYVGGLVGYNNNYSTIDNSYTTGTVSGTDWGIGGLVGYSNNYSNIDNSYATGTVLGVNDVGGLAGAINNYSTISNSYFTGNVSGASWVGGLAGYSRDYSTISGSHVAGTVSGNSTVGGLVGRNYRSSSISNSYASAAVSGVDSVGGLVGENFSYSTMDNSYTTGSVSGNEQVGGLVGYNDNSSVTNSYATGIVSGAGWATGGLVGHNANSSTINSSYATGSVTGGSEATGGLVGYQRWSATIDNSYATGTVTGVSRVGGLVGENNIDSSVSRSYAAGNVLGDDRVGGLVGYNIGGGAIDNSYATGTVLGSTYAGGLVGYNTYDSTIDNSYFTDKAKDNGLGTLEAAGISAFYLVTHPVYNGATAWDFVTVWQAYATVLPHLRWEHYTLPAAASSGPPREAEVALDATLNALNNPDFGGNGGMATGDEMLQPPVIVITSDDVEVGRGQDPVVESFRQSLGELLLWPEINFGALFDEEEARKKVTRVKVVNGAVYVIDGENEMSLMKEGDVENISFKVDPAGPERSAAFQALAGKPDEGTPPESLTMGQTAGGMRYGTLKNPGKNVFVKGKDGIWKPASDGMVLLPGDEVRTLGEDTVDLLLDHGEVGKIKVQGGAIFRINKMEEDPLTKDRTTLIDLAIGKMLVTVEKLKGNSKFEVRTPTALSGVRGTEFEIEVKEEKDAEAQAAE